MDLALSPSIEFCMSLLDIIAQVHYSFFNIKLNIPREGGIVFYVYICLSMSGVLSQTDLLSPFFDLQCQDFELFMSWAINFKYSL